MGFKRLLASLGAGGASVETVLTEVNVVPGGVVQGGAEDLWLVQNLVACEREQELLPPSLRE